MADQDLPVIKATLRGIQGIPGASNVVDIVEFERISTDFQDTIIFPTGERYTPNNNGLFVFINGLLLPPSNYVEVDPTTIKLNTPLQSGDNITVKAFLYQNIEGGDIVNLIKDIVNSEGGGSGGSGGSGNRLRDYFLTSGSTRNTTPYLRGSSGGGSGAGATSLILTGALFGNATSENGLLRVETSLTADSVTLGLHTTGEYVKNIRVEGEGLSVIGVGEGANVKLTINSSTESDANTLVLRNEDSSINVNGINSTGDSFIENLTVTNLTVTDQFISQFSGGLLDNPDIQEYIIGSAANTIELGGETTNLIVGNDVVMGGDSLTTTDSQVDLFNSSNVTQVEFAQFTEILNIGGDQSVVNLLGNGVTIGSEESLVTIGDGLKVTDYLDVSCIISETGVVEFKSDVLVDSQLTVTGTSNVTDLISSGFIDVATITSSSDKITLASPVEVSDTINVLGSVSAPIADIDTVNSLQSFVDDLFVDEIYSKVDLIKVKSDLQAINVDVTGDLSTNNLIVGDNIQSTSTTVDVLQNAEEINIGGDTSVVRLSNDVIVSDSLTVLGAFESADTKSVVVETLDFRDFLIFTFDATKYRSAKLIIQVEDTTREEYQVLELLLMSTATDVFQIEYANMSTTDSSISSFVCNKFGNFIAVYSKSDFTFLTYTIKATLLEAH